MSIVRRLEEDGEYARQALVVCGVDTGEVDEGIRLRLNLLVKNKKVVNVTYVKYYTKLMDGDIGPDAYMGSVIWKGKLGDTICKYAMDKFNPIFTKLDPSTFLSIDLSIGESKIGVMGFKPDISLGYIELYKGDYTSIHLDYEAELKIGWAITVTLAAIPFPLPISMSYALVEVQGIDKHNIKHIFLHNTQLVDDRYMGTGKLGEVTAYGETLREARRRAYRTVDKIKVPGLMYRRDIGADVIRIQKLLNTWGWIEDVPPL